MKITEFRDLADEELQQRLRETKKELFNLRVQQSTGRIEKPSRIRDLRRAVARMNTVVTERSKQKR